MDSITQIDFLGFSPDAASLLLNSLRKQHPDAGVRIIENIPIDTTIPYSATGDRIDRISISEVQSPLDGISMICAVKPDSKVNILDSFAELFSATNRFTTLVDPDATVAQSASIADGCFIEPKVVISPFAMLDEHVTVNRSTSIGHHTTIGRFSTIHPGCHVAGHCAIGERTRIGIGTIVFDHVSIGSDCVIGGGSVVNKDIPAGSIAWGNPCVVKRRKS